jgi:hypothetical protein
MKAALHGAAIASYAGQFVWLDLNVDEPRNAGFLTAHMGMASPVLLIIDPDTGAVDRVWTGSATGDQLIGFLGGAAVTPPTRPIKRCSAAIACSARATHPARPARTNKRSPPAARRGRAAITPSSSC